MKLTALILSGGRGSRLGGQDKGLVKYHNQPLVERALAMVRPRCGQIVISANRNLEQFSHYGYPVVSDLEPGFRGPLMGIHSAMSYLEARHTDISDHWLLTLPCDMPDIPEKVFDDLETRARQQQQPVIASDAQGYQYLLGLLPLSLHENLKRYLATGRNKVADWILSLKPIVVSSQTGSSYQNINREEDLNNGR